MDEQMLREMVRQAIARKGEPGREGEPRLLPLTSHASHYRYDLPPSGGPCLIEPTVQCNHCGYCESHGH